MGVTILGDPILDPFGVNRVTILLANYLAQHEPVTVVSSQIAEDVRPHFRTAGIELLDLGTRLINQAPSTAFGEAWLRETLFHTNGRRWERQRSAPSGPVVNLSNTIVAPADVWYLQGPVGSAIATISRQRMGALGQAIGWFSPLLDFLDECQVREAHARSRLRIANSEYCRSSYAPFGLPVERVIYPPLDTSVFRPSTQTPQEDYCVVYQGKETDPMILRSLAEAGVRLRAFGSKLGEELHLKDHPNLTIESRLSDVELARLYSHAKMTIFPFTIEPFGYIPVESLACGTPVLTYARQGPAETTTEGVTGWHAPDSKTMVERAVELWKGPAIARDMRSTCIRSVDRYSLPHVGETWREALAGLPSATRA